MSGFIRSHQSTVSLIQFLSDTGLLAGTLWLSVYLSGYPWSDRYTIAALGGVLLYYLLAEMNGLYVYWHSASLSWELKQLAWSWLWVVLVFLLLAFVAKVSTEYSRQVMLTWFVLAPLAVGLWHWWFRALLRKLQLFGFYPRRVAIAGAGDLGKRLAQTIDIHTSMGFSITGFYDDKLERDSLVESISVRGNLETLIQDAKNGQMDCIYIALPMSAEKRIKALLSDLTDTAVVVYMIPDLFIFDLLHSRWQNMAGLPIISIYGSPLNGMGGVLKRLEDVILSLFILLVMAIPMCIIALGVKLTSPGPVLFRQRRYGLGGENIWVWKFRTSTTAFGQFLRRTSLDKLPQFTNVLLGQMSIVGPRPHSTWFNQQFRQRTPKYMLRHLVKPGITGWAEVNGFGGDETKLAQMETHIAYDLYYIENWSLWLDIKIVILTILKGCFLTIGNFYGKKK